MNAKEMFEKLGFNYKFMRYDSCEDAIIYDKYPLTIQFNTISKGIVLQDDANNKIYGRTTVFLNRDLLKAINKQVEELGWLDD